MIVTVTPNPSVDRTYEIPALAAGEINRAARVHQEPSGKGVNVTRALTVNGVPSLAVLPSGGPEGATLIALLAAEQVAYRAVPIAGSVRVNISLAEPGGRATKINEAGAPLDQGELDRLTAEALAAAGPGDWIVCSGSLPPGAPPDYYARAGQRAHEAGLRFALDTSGDALRAGLAADPDVIKPNVDELAEVTGTPIMSPGGAIAGARLLLARGAGSVLVSMGADGALLVSPGGTWHASAEAPRVRSTVGAGDALLAGFLAGGGAGQDALREAVLWATAAVGAAGSHVPLIDGTVRAAIHVQITKESGLSRALVRLAGEVRPAYGQAVAQSGRLRGGQAGQHLLLQGCDLGAVTVQQVVSLGRQGHHHAAPVPGVAVPLDHPALFERANHVRHGLGGHERAAGQLCGGEAGAVLEHGQRRVLQGGHPDRPEDLIQPRPDRQLDLLHHVQQGRFGAGSGIHLVNTTVGKLLSTTAGRFDRKPVHLAVAVTLSGRSQRRGSPMRPRSAVRVLATAAAITVAALGASGADAATAPASTHYTGSLADGASWIADVPASWNGTIILFSHGFGPLAAQDAPDPATQADLLNLGYALAGSSYSGSSWWALASATRDQFASLAAVEHTVGRPRRVIAWGESMGGLVSAEESQNAHGRINGTLTTCGLVAGALSLNNYQLDGEYALNQLLDPGQQIQLVRYASAGQASAAAAALAAVTAAAQSTAAGRARIALAAALLNEPTWFTGTAPPAPPTTPRRNSSKPMSWPTLCCRSSSPRATRSSWPPAATVPSPRASATPGSSAGAASGPR